MRRLSPNAPCVPGAPMPPLAASWSTSPTTTLGPYLQKPTPVDWCDTSLHATVVETAYFTGHSRGGVVEGPTRLPSVGRPLSPRGRHRGAVQRRRPVGRALWRVRVLVNEQSSVTKSAQV